MSGSPSTRKIEGRRMRFFCTQCARCCRYEEGFVFLSSGDVRLLAEHLEETEENLIARYCHWVPMGLSMQLSLREQRNRDCIFWRDGGCEVYTARPRQCRTYPFWQHIVETRESWELEGQTCPGIGVGPYHSQADVNHALATRRRELPIVKPYPRSQGVRE
jgi:uncharacterized protein